MATESLFTTEVPLSPAANDSVDYEMGMKFQVAVPGSITAIRYYKPVNTTVAVTGHIWSAGGTELASVVFSTAAFGDQGWTQADLAVPLNIAAGTTYTVSVDTGTTMYYAFTGGGLSGGFTNGNITAVAGSNGVYGTTLGVMPTGSFGDANYFRDIVFEPARERLFNDLTPNALSGAITDSQTSITVTESLPVAGNFRAKIDDELMHVTLVIGTTWTVTRGVEDTTAASHASSSEVHIVGTSEGFNTWLDDELDDFAIVEMPFYGLAYCFQRNTFLP